MNAVLFVLLTKQVRDSFLQPFSCRSVMRGNEQAAEKIESSDTAHLLTNIKQDDILSAYHAVTPGSSDDLNYVIMCMT